MKSGVVLFFLVWASTLFGGWAEQTLRTMTLDEKIGQLFVIPICPPRGEAHAKHLKRFAETYPIGNVIVKTSCPEEQIEFFNRLQKNFRIPLMTLADAEWGLGMRMKETFSYPKNITIGAIQNLSLLEKIGSQIGEQCRLVGIHINLAPVADVNTNPKNPIIHMRSFGDHAHLVARQVSAVLLGMQREGVLACAKHFPGHGDTTTDSHHDLPLVSHSVNRLQKEEWVPFRKAIYKGIRAMMSAHLLVPDLDTVPCTFSHHLITDVLKKQLHFDGLVITDALNMKALTNYFSPGEIALQAFLAGHHLLLYGDHIEEVVDAILSDHVPQGFQAIKKACHDGKISEKELNERVLRILEAKEELGLHQNRFIPCVDDLMAQLHKPEYYQLRQTLFEEAVTLYRDEGLPSNHEKIAYVQAGKSTLSPFFFFLKDAFNLNPFIANDRFDGSKLQPFNSIIVGYYGGEISKNLRLALADKQVYFAHFTSPYDLTKLPDHGTVVVGYEDMEESEKVVSCILQGKSIAKGQLPITLPPLK